MSDQTDYILQEILTELRRMNEFTVRLNTRTNTNIHVNSIAQAARQMHKREPDPQVDFVDSPTVYPFGRQP